jgi:hypothetical protein
MKKIKTISLIVMLSVALTTNVIASGTGAASAFGVFSGIVEYTLSLFRDNEEICPLRQCTNCRPLNGVDENGNCRPRD